MIDIGNVLLSKTQPHTSDTSNTRAPILFPFLGLRFYFSPVTLSTTSYQSTLPDTMHDNTRPRLGHELDRRVSGSRTTTLQLAFESWRAQAVKLTNTLRTEEPRSRIHHTFPFRYAGLYFSVLCFPLSPDSIFRTRM